MSVTGDQRNKSLKEKLTPHQVDLILDAIKKMQFEKESQEEILLELAEMVYGED